MFFWLLLVFIFGALLVFAADFLVAHNLLWCIGVATMLVCVGLGMRVDSQRRRARKAPPAPGEPSAPGEPPAPEG